jgi:hypothetical protein
VKVTTTPLAFLPSAWISPLTRHPTLHSIPADTNRDSLARCKHQLRLSRLARALSHPFTATKASELPTSYYDPWTQQHRVVDKIHSRPILAMDLQKFCAAAYIIPACRPLLRVLDSIFHNLKTISDLPHPPCPASPPWAHFIAMRLVNDGLASQCDPLSVAPGILGITAEKLETPDPRIRVLTDTLWANLHPHTKQRPEAIGGLVQSLPELYTALSTMLSHHTPTFAASVDLEKSFFQVHIPPHSQKVFGFTAFDPTGQLRGYKMTRMAMGYVDAVDVMHRIMVILCILVINHPKFVAVAKDFIIDVYVDNAAIFTTDVATGTIFLLLFPQIASTFGITIGDTQPVSQTISHRGITFDLKSATATIKADKLRRLHNRLTTAAHMPLTTPLLHTLVSQLIYVDTALNLYNAKRVHALVSDVILARASSKHNHILSPKATAELHSASMWSSGSVNLCPPRLAAARSFVSDASDIGFALGTRVGNAIWSMAGSFQSHLKQTPIYAREAIPVIIATTICPTVPKLFLLDNTTLVYAINRRYSPSPALHAILQMILTAAPAAAAWVPTAWNVMDAPSRGLPFTTTSPQLGAVPIDYDGLDGCWRRPDTLKVGAITAFITHQIKPRSLGDYDTSPNSTLNLSSHPCSNTEKVETKKLCDSVLGILRNVLLLFTSACETDRNAHPFHIKTRPSLPDPILPPGAPTP